MARQKKNRKAARIARKQARAERLSEQRQRQQAKRQVRKATIKKARQERAEISKARRVSRELEQKNPVLYEREQKAATGFFGHTPNARELNAWRGLVNSGTLDRIRELTFINYEPEAVKDAAKDLLKSDLSSDEVISALEGYIKQYSVKEQSLYDYVSAKYGKIIPR